jgi:Holliday junction resolvase-like predicted endonuclease
MYLAIKRLSKLGILGEQLAEECLALAGFEKIENLNRRANNYPFADILATRHGARYFIGVKTRNEFQANGKINPSYNAVLIRSDKKRQLESSGKTEAQITTLLWTEVQALADQWEAVPAWVTVATQPLKGIYSAYFGLVSSLGNRRSIPMKTDDRRVYEVLAERNADTRITKDLHNSM